MRAADSAGSGTGVMFSAQLSNLASFPAARSERKSTQSPFGFNPEKLPRLAVRDALSKVLPELVGEMLRSSGCQAPVSRPLPSKLEETFW